MLKFNIPTTIGNEIRYLKQVIRNRKFSGDGHFNKESAEFLWHMTGAKACFLVPSGTAALELAALALDIKPGDEVIMPSYTFTSTANAFVLRGARIVFVDIRPDTMNIDEDKIEAAITKRTKAIVPVHYAGVACEMDKIMQIARRHKLFVIEDAAQALGSYYKGRALGAIGHLGCLSFHETKNIQSGEGGAILVNDASLVPKIEILREKGTDRSKFFRGEIDKYGWIDRGSSYLLSELNAAFLYAQLRQVKQITADRRRTYLAYQKGLSQLAQKGFIELCTIPQDCISNFHIFFIKLKNKSVRQKLIDHLKSHQINVVFHYLPLHRSRAGRKYGRFAGRDEYTTKESEKLLRLPLFYKLPQAEVAVTIGKIYEFFGLKFLPERIKADSLAAATRNFSLFSVQVAIILGVTYWLGRFGFDHNSFGIVLKVWGLAFFTLLLPDVLWQKLKTEERWYNCRPMVLLYGLLVLTGAGLLSSLIALWYLFVPLGFVFLAVFLVDYFRLFKVREFFKTLLYALFISSWIIGVLWGTHILSPLFLEEIAFGNPYTDTLFHVNISSMISTYLIPSTGLEGLVNLNYHWGSHLIFAELAKLIKLHPLFFYNLAYPVIFAPLFLKSILELLVVVRRQIGAGVHSYFKLYLVLFLSLAGIFTTVFLERIGLSNFSIFVSESYLVGMTFLFIFLGAIVTFWRKYNEESKVSQSLFSILFLPLTIVVASFTKSALGYLLLGTYVYIFLRFRLYRQIPAIISLGLSLLFGGLVYQLTFTEGTSAVVFFDFINHWVSPDLKYYFWFLYYFMAWLFVILRFRQLKIFRLSTLKEAIAKRTILDVEILAVFSILGVLPGTVLQIAGGSAGLFSEVQYFLAAALILAYLPLFWPNALKESLGSFKLTNLSLGKAFFYLVLLSFFVVALTNTTACLKEFAIRNGGVRISFLPEDHPLRREGSLKYFTGIFQETKLNTFNKLRDLIREPQRELNRGTNQNYQTVKLLYDLGENFPDKKNSAIFIPQENYAYWNMLEYLRVHFLPGALSQMALVEGIQPFVMQRLSQPEMDKLTAQLSEEDKTTVARMFTQDGQTLTLNKDLNREDKIKLYDLVAHRYSERLANYSFASYNTRVTEAEYLNQTKDTETLCARAREKNITRLLTLQEVGGQQTISMTDCPK